MDAAEKSEHIFYRLAEWGCDIEGGRERFLEDDELYLKCLKRFAKDPGFLNLKCAVQEKDWKGAYEAAHTLKGTSATLNVSPLYQIIKRVARQVEEGKKPDEEELGEQMKTLGKAFSEYCSRIGH